MLGDTRRPARHRHGRPAFQQAVVFVLDVGPRMHLYLAQADRATADVMTDKARGTFGLQHPLNHRIRRLPCFSFLPAAVVNYSPSMRDPPLQIVLKAKHQVCLLLCGASETRNQESDKAALEEGGEGDYSHIVEAHRSAAAAVRMAAPCMLLGPLDGDYNCTLHTIAPGHCHSDFKMALAVAAAVLVGQEGFRGTRRIVLLSNLCSREAQEDPQDALTSVLGEGLQQREIALEVVHLDVEAGCRIPRTYNLNQVAAICQQLSHNERHFPSATALLSAFKFKVPSSATFSGHLGVGTKLHIPVRAVDKSASALMAVLVLGQPSPSSMALAWRRNVSCPLAPLLVAPTLSASQFGTAIKSVQDVLSKDEIRWELVMAATAVPPSGSTPNQ
ncbi:hypothetical protein D9Q98_007127 [Chlorella vulgaris]|uniref:Uncharacterized protein n=1 Tax=Chlorella vulgaris TaxID=3077 RepID=A0A9D4YUV3_CHLVU|nr:hypothetical protein D9Q98_007127 [Chlorella vulgaris]